MNRTEEINLNYTGGNTVQITEADIIRDYALALDQSVANAITGLMLCFVLAYFILPRSKEALQQSTFIYTFFESKIIKSMWKGYDSAIDFFETGLIFCILYLVGFGYFQQIYNLANKIILIFCLLALGAGFIAKAIGAFRKWDYLRKKH